MIAQTAWLVLLTIVIRHVLKVVVKHIIRNCHNYYRPQTKFAKVMFLQASVCPQGRGRAWLLPGVHGCSRRRGVWLLRGGVHACCRGGGVRACSRGGVRACSRGACVLAPGGRACLLRGEACVVFSMRYGRWAGGMHPTGMHSCLFLQSQIQIKWTGNHRMMKNDFLNI